MLDVLNMRESNVRLVRETKFIRIPGPQELLAVQNLLFVLRSVRLTDLYLSDGLSQERVIVFCMCFAVLKLSYNLPNFRHPSRVIWQKGLDVDQVLEAVAVRERYFWN